MWNLLRAVRALYDLAMRVDARGIFGVVLLGLALGAPGHANAAALVNCTTVTINLSVAPTTDVLVPSQVGSVVYTGTVTANRTCDIASSINVFNVIVLGSNIGSTTTVKGSGSWLGIRVVSHNVSIVQAGAGTCATTLKQQNFGSSQTWLHAHFVGSTVGARCTVTYSYKFEVYVKQLAGAAVVAFPWADPTGYSPAFYGTSAWVVWEDNGSTTFWNLAAVSSNFVPVGCTLSATNIVVNLASASASELDTAGKTAQPQAFNIVLTGCLARASPYAAVATWSFTQLGANASVITNSAPSGAAGNVGIQLLDGSSNPITSNGTSTLVSIPAAGTYSSTHYARYYAVGAATGGTVRGLATFNLTYN